MGKVVLVKEHNTIRPLRNTEPVDASSLRLRSRMNPEISYYELDMPNGMNVDAFCEAIRRYPMLLHTSKIIKEI